MQTVWYSFYTKIQSYLLPTSTYHNHYFKTAQGSTFHFLSFFINGFIFQESGQNLSRDPKF